MSAATVVDDARGCRAGRVVAPSTRRGAVLRVVGRALVGAPARVLLGLLWVYQRFISPLTPATCRYYPSCSQYAVIAVRRHGAVRGTWLAIRRLGRCHPWAAGGVDDVPAAGSFGGAPTAPAAELVAAATVRADLGGACETPARSGGPERARSSRR